MKSDQLSKPKLAPIASQRAKFSNLVLFDRREKEFIAHQKKDKKLEKLKLYLTDSEILESFVKYLKTNQINKMGDEIAYEYGNLLSSIDNLADSNSKVYAIMYLNYINGYYQNLIERLMPLNPLKAIKILNQMVKVTQKYIIDDANFGQK